MSFPSAAGSRRSIPTLGTGGQLGRVPETVAETGGKFEGALLPTVPPANGPHKPLNTKSTKDTFGRDYSHDRKAPQHQVLTKPGNFEPTPFTLIEPSGARSRYEW